MKIIEQQAELVKSSGYTIDDIYNDIERAGRISYKSESKGDAKGFIERLIKSKHLSPLEFGTVYIHISVNDNDNYYSVLRKYMDDHYSQVTVGMDDAYITTNMRVIYENGRQDDLKYLCEPTEYHTKRYTLHCVTSIGISRELNRHRHSSIMEQSTRYCNYSKDKFGNEVTFIKPIWYDETLEDNEYKDNKSFIFLSSCHSAEDDYINLIRLGAKPQEAREVLPLSTATEVMYCMFEDDLKHLLDLRVKGTTGAPHPQVKELLTPICEQIYNKL